MVTIGLIGHLAEGEKKYDGQTVSTRAWKTELSDKRHDFSLITVDTYNYSNRKVEIIKEIVHCMAKCSHIVFMLS